MLTVSGRKIEVDTRTLKAVMDGGLITSLVRKSDGRQLINVRAGQSPPLQLVYTTGEVVDLGCADGDRITCLRHNDYQAEVRVESWYGDGVITVSEDRETGDLIVEPAGYASRPGLRSCRWTMAGIDDGLELVAPFWQGVRLSLVDPLIRNTFWNWPQSWEAGLAILQGAEGGLWVHCRDDRYRFKNLQVGTADDSQRLGFETEAYGPLDDNLAAGGLPWRINVYEGDWQVPASIYRDWLAEAYGLDGVSRPGWVDELRLALSWCPCEPAILEALAARVEPGCVLLHVPNWRTDGYDQGYPRYEPSAEAKAFIRKGQAMGFRMMPHFNAIDMDPTHPAYHYIRDFQYRDAVSQRVQGWSWYEGASRPVPESNATRMRSRDKKTMVKVHAGLSMWRSILAENIRQAAAALSLDCVFLDVTMNTWNLRRCMVENVTSTEGMKRLIAHMGLIDGVAAVGGEGRNEIVMQDEAFAQVHLFKSSGPQNIEGLERTGRCPLCEFLFGRWCRSFGYSHLAGQTPEQCLRMQLHVDLGAIRTLTVQSAGEIATPNESVDRLLSEAGGKAM